MYRTQRGQQTRKAILQAAFELFLRQGYHGTSMRHLAQHAGISPSAIYAHFEGKEDIYASLLAEHIPYRALLEAVSQAQGATVDDLVHDALRRMHASMADQLDNMRLMFIELLEFQGRHVPSLAGGFLPGALQFVERLQQADRRLRPFSPLIVLRAIGGLFVSYAITSLFLKHVPGFSDDPADLQALGELLLHGLVASPAEGVGGASSRRPRRV